ncbi:hypothetical protein DFH08DRAFT_974818 [Mycena albidolilacea]|uniref:Uncharacterized protein n=1 Tax=Mycena albidolilacea TaxID=1033008 RepID=A0AAD6Z6B3_9AGAR|nr:hypothetical protein DFH08DRAFT_974818 [Mycena albidolilacea]
MPSCTGLGVLSSAHLKEARAARAVYHATLEDIARCAGKNMSTVFKAIGGYPKSVQDTNSWNAYQMKYRIERLQLLKTRCLCVEPLMKWHCERTMQVVDNRKADGGGKALMNKAVASLIRQSTAVSSSLNIKVFGLALDCFGDNAIIWGRGTLFQEVFKQHPLPIRRPLIDMKGLFQMTSLYLQNQAETVAAPSMMQPVPITFTRLPMEASKHDALHRQLTALFKMLWKWANSTCKHQLRIENWPAALKEMYPGPGFSLGIITEKENRKEEKRTHISEPDVDDGLESMKIVSWTDKEIELEDPSNVPIVSCDDGTVLLWASAAKSLLAKIKKSKKSSKKKTRVTANASSADNMDDEDEMPPPPPKSGKAKAPTAAGTPTLAAATSDVAPAAGHKQIKFRNRNSEVMSDVFSATELVRYTGTPTNV